MKSMWFVPAVFLVTPVVAQTPPAPAAAPAVDPARLDAARKLIDTILPPASRDAMFAQMVNTMMANMVRGIIEGQHLGELFEAHPDARAIFSRFVDRQRQFSIDDLKAATPALIDAEARPYVARLSLAELTQIQQFSHLRQGRNIGWRAWRSSRIRG